MSLKEDIYLELIQQGAYLKVTAIHTSGIEVSVVGPPSSRAYLEKLALMKLEKKRGSSL